VLIVQPTDDTQQDVISKLEGVADVVVDQKVSLIEPIERRSTTEIKQGVIKNR